VIALEQKLDNKSEAAASGRVSDSADDRHRIRQQQQSDDQVQGIEAKNLTVVYRNGNVGLRDASFSIPRSTICALVGVNGSGKSTLFKALMGFVSIATGSVSILGEPAGKMLKRNIVAYVPQNEEVDWNFPVLVEDVVMMGRYGHMGWLRRPSRQDHAKVEEALQRVDMQDYRKRQIGELSGGQKKRVFLARALAQEGQVILLDEPFTGVDVNSENAIIELFTQDNLQRAFGGTLRFHVLGGAELHDDDDARRVTVISDDERPVVLYGEEQESANKTDADADDKSDATVVDPVAGKKDLPPPAD